MSRVMGSAVAVLALSLAVAGWMVMNTADGAKPAPDAGSVPLDTAAAEVAAAAGVPWDRVDVDRVVDGDTIWTNVGKVRIIGFDTPEVDECGYERATDVLSSLVADASTVELGNPVTVQDADRYGRLLRHVRIDGEDVGADMIAAGLAVARYDSRDGYDWHPFEDVYRALDAQAVHICG